jgi:small subunit ribosomal protein S7
MYDGKKSVPERIFYDAMKVIEEKTGQPARACSPGAEQRQAGPRGEVPPRRWRDLPGSDRGAPGATQALAMRWLIQYSRARGEKTMADRLAAELIAASRNEGATIKKKDDTHRMAEANKAFAHYRW